MFAVLCSACGAGGHPQPLPACTGGGLSEGCTARSRRAAGSAQLHAAGCAGEGASNVARNALHPNERTGPSLGSFVGRPTPVFNRAQPVGCLVHQEKGPPINFEPNFEPRSFSVTMVPVPLLVHQLEQLQDVTTMCPKDHATPVSASDSDVHDNW